MSVLLYLAILSLLCPIYGEVFTAMADMEKLFDIEQDVAGVIDRYIDAEKKRLSELRSLAESYNSRNKAVAKGGVQAMANPVNAFKIVKQLRANWGDIEELIRYNSAEDFLYNITTQRNEALVKFPGREDVEGAASGLLRLQDTYKLSTAEVADGQIQGVKRAPSLTAGDCFQLGKIAYNQQDYYHTLMWMQEALDRHEREKRDLKDPAQLSADESEILEHLAFAMFQQGNVKHALRLTKRLAAADPNHPRAAGNVKYYEDKLREDGLKPGGELPPIINTRQNTDSVPERSAYEDLCRGRNFKTPKEEKLLHCTYKRDHPYLKLAPIKYEVVHWKPKIVIFRQVISDNEMEQIKKIAHPKLKRATVHNKNTGQLEHASYRISKSAWLEDWDDEVVHTVNNRIEMMTNLDLERAELLQIANYGIGGHYDPHYDMSTKDEVDAFDRYQGNRIATVLFYMSQPEAGGATVFPILKVSLFPTKGDAAFWFNILHTGEGDMSTRHAGCPVLAGTKWVSNKWIHERGQEFKRKCFTKEHSDYQNEAKFPLYTP
jgi:prolyl 4-hydroxylase